MTYPADWKNVACHDWYEDEKKIWLCLENKNAICEIDKSSKDIKILGSYPHNRLGEHNLSLTVKKHGDYIIFCPFQANDIALFNINTGILEFIDIRWILEEHNYICKGTEKFYRMFFYENYAYFLGIKYPAIMRLDLASKKIDLFNEWMEEIELHKCKEAVLFTDGYAQNKDEVYLPIGRCNGVLKINLSTMEWQYIEIADVSHGILGMTQKENLIWITEYDVGAKHFFQWNLDSGKIIMIDLPCQDCFYAPLYYNQSLLFTPNFGNKSYIYELESGQWKDVTNILPDWKKSSVKKFSENEIKYFANGCQKFCHWNINTNEIFCDEIQIQEEGFLNDSWIDYCEYYKNKLNNHIVSENELTIKEYIKLLNIIL